MKPHITTARKTFENGCERARGLTSIFELLVSIAPPALNCDDILRSALVLAVSSFDLFIHDLLRLEALDRLINKRQVQYLRVPFDSLIRGGQEQADFVNSCIRNDHSHKSFVAPDKLAEGLRPLVSNPWDQIAVAFGAQGSTCKSRLKAVVDLRNRIAHEADVNPDYGGLELWPIYIDDVRSSIDFLGKLGDVIVNVVDAQ